MEKNEMAWKGWDGWVGGCVVRGREVVGN